MPGTGRSEQPALRALGAVVGLIAVIGYLLFGWSFSGSGTIPRAIGIIVAVSAIGWTLYNRVSGEWL